MIDLPTGPLRLKAPAKVNLWLRVLGKRADGYHELETRMCPLSLHDVITIDHPAEGGELQFFCDAPGVPTDEENLVVRAVRALEEAGGQHFSISVKLEKNIPSGAGLGGGSSDAANVLKALNGILQVPLSPEKLVAVAAGIGADVPFFLYGGTCDCSGVGEVVCPVDFPHEIPLLLVKPAFGVPTPWAYQHWAGSEELSGVRYTPQPMPWGVLENGLERPVFTKYLLLPELKMWLLEQPEVEGALMSGSGATVFAVLRERDGGRALAERVRRRYGETTWVYLCKTLTG